MYEIWIGPAQSGQSAVYKDIQFGKLGEAVSSMRSLLSVMPDLSKDLEEDTKIQLVKVPSRAKKNPEPAKELLQIICGLDEDSQEFCYEGIYFLSSCSASEQKAALGSTGKAFLGKYGVIIEASMDDAPSQYQEVCIFSDLDMILQSVLNLAGSSDDEVPGKLMSVYRRDHLSQAKPVAQFLYTKGDQGVMELETHIQPQALAEEKEQIEKLAFHINEALKNK